MGIFPSYGQLKMAAMPFLEHTDISDILKKKKFHALLLWLLEILIKPSQRSGKCVAAPFNKNVSTVIAP